MNKTEIVKVRATPDEYAALAEIAQQERVKPSEALRLIIRSEAKRRGLWPPNDGTFRRIFGESSRQAAR